MWKLVLAAGVVMIVSCPASSTADMGPPVHLQVTERAAGVYSVRWRVPKVLPARAIPTPVIPDGCEARGEPAVLDQSGAWLFEQECRCDGGLPGQTLGMRYPFPDLALTTVIRVELLSGDRFAHVLTPGEGPWRVPQGTATPDLLGQARRALLAGVNHALGSWVHLAFLLVLGSLGGLREPIRLVTAFTLGQLVSASIAAIPGISPGPMPVELGLAVVVALLARESLRQTEDRRRLGSLSAAAGLIHGLGMTTFLETNLGDLGLTLASRIISILGMDSVHLVVALSVAGLWQLMSRRFTSPRGRRVVLYGTGVVGMALAVSFAMGGAITAGVAESSLQFPGEPLARSSRVGGSRRVAPAVPETPLQSFLTVEPFEVRHEVMVRLAGLSDFLELDSAPTLRIEDQPEIIEQLTQFVLLRTLLEVDGKEIAPLFRRADFMLVGPTGAFPRPNPVIEDLSEAVVGIVVSYPIPGIPEAVTLAWTRFPGTSRNIPATVIDPETVISSTLSPEQPQVTWSNLLVEDPIPTVDAVVVEPSRVSVPWLSLPLVVLAVAILVSGTRRLRPRFSIAAARVILALAILAGPLVQTAVALPGSEGRVPSERQARRILAGLLPNIYRALEFRDEGMIYDRLAVSVTGETLSEVYLQQRRTLQMEERGGAQARVESVEIQKVSEIGAQDSGFGVRAMWTVGGMVTHFGHRHFRQNRHDARIRIVPVDGTWKIQSIDVLEQERIR